MAADRSRQRLERTAKVRSVYVDDWEEGLYEELAASPEETKPKRKREKTEGDGVDVPCRKCGKVFRVAGVKNKDRALCPECVEKHAQMMAQIKPLPYKVEKILDSRSCANKEDGRELYVKWKDRSYLHCEWVPEIQVQVQHPTLHRLYQRRHEEKETQANSEGESDRDDDGLWANGRKVTWTNVHRIISERPGETEPEYFVKWEDLGYDQCTWELQSTIEKKFSNEIAAFHEREQAVNEPPELSPTRNVQKYHEQPSFVTRLGGNLHPYQLEGLNWLRHSWSAGINTILADEMGLGKTIQTVTFLGSLFSDSLSHGPFLVCVPLSTLRNWEREFQRWTPFLNLVSYTGSAEARQTIRDFEFHASDSSKVQATTIKRQRRVGSARLKMHVLLTSFEMAMADSTVLGSVPWEVLIVDEAHRLKNNNSKFFKQLKDFQADYRLLLTGTPLQNNLDELFHLLNFLSPKRFGSLENFQAEFADVAKEEQIARLHALLGPHMLRRLKADVLTNMPSKSEVIVCVNLNPLQKKFYCHILKKNYEALNRGRGKQRQVSLLNIMAELKKICNHPYLFSAARDEDEASITRHDSHSPDVNGTDAWHLLHASAKLALLDKMLLRLHATGHRVLIFSQMTRLLDILEEYMRVRQFKYERIDGSVAGSDRQARIDSFNSPNAPQFCFLLSTRAGGLGINLATADTVIIYDSDWNPHNDIQAFSRAHRIGQSNKVMIYRFVTRGSVEERIVELAKRKMMLTHLVVGSMAAKSATLTKDELEDILRFGTADLFAEQVGDASDTRASDIVYDDDAVEKLLDRTVKDDVEHKENIPNEYLSSFKVATYSVVPSAETPQDVPEETSTSTQDPDYWEKLLRPHYEEEQSVIAASMGKGKRTRKPVNYAHAEFAATELDDDADNNSEYEAGTDSVSSDEDQLTDEDDELRTIRKRDRSSTGHASANAANKKPEVAVDCCGFTARDRQVFRRAFMQLGLPRQHWTLIVRSKLPTKSAKDIEAYASLLLQHLCEPETNSDTFLDGLPREDFQRQEYLERIGVMELVRRKVEECRPAGSVGVIGPTIAVDKSIDLVVDPSTDASTAAAEQLHNKEARQQYINTLLQPANEDWSVWAENFHIADSHFTPLQAHWQAADSQMVVWSRRHDFLLLIGVLLYGHGSWGEILRDSRMQLREVALHDIQQPAHGQVRVLPSADALEAALGKFCMRRMAMLERALLIEDQLVKAGQAGMHVDPGAPELALLWRVQDICEQAQSMDNVFDLAFAGDKAACMQLRKDIRAVDSLLSDCREDFQRLPFLLAACPPLQNMLGLAERDLLTSAAQELDENSVLPPPTTAATAEQEATGDAVAAADDEASTAVKTEDVSGATTGDTQTTVAADGASDGTAVQAMQADKEGE
eukprot:m.205742 g.205742  ORF g.205742 m.205742 type:complete len:1395 (-) comp17765_c0_seq1:329-4513(-)